MSPVERTARVPGDESSESGRQPEDGAPSGRRARDIAGTARGTATRRYAGLVDRWALIVGVSRYAHAPRIPNLSYAHRDAEALAAFLRTPAGGGYADDKLVLLVDEGASTAALTRNLRSFLKRPVETDVVTIYFAGHGAPDPDRPANHYFLTHDTDPDDIAGTAVPMREIRIALADTLHAEGVMVFLDTCHSGGAMLGGGGYRAAADGGVNRAWLDDFDRGGRGIAVMTSAGHDQTSRESAEWGGGHGVFTHYLIEGMRGKADGHGGRPRNGRVSIGELFDYVRENVRRAVPTQHPTVGNYRFDRSMLVSNTGEISASELAEQATLLERLARRVQQPWRFRDAAALYREAAEFADRAGGDVAEREVHCGRCLLQAGDVDDAIVSLERAIERHPDIPLPKALFYLAVAHARRHDHARAAVAMRAVLEADDEHENARWVAGYLDWLERRSAGRRRALVIGIGEYLGEVPPIAGCVTDARILWHVLERDGLFEDVRPLLDDFATRANILEALASLGERLGADDHAWVSFSGHSVAEVQREASATFGDDDYLIVHDSTEDATGLVNGISPAELHRAMLALPAGHKTLVLDTHYSSEMVRLAESGDYTLLLASESAELSFETEIRFEGERRQAGLFTAALATALAESDPGTLDFDSLRERVATRMGERDRRQRPLFVGDTSRPVFGIEDVYLAALDLAKRRDHDALGVNVLAERCRRIDRQLDAPWPEYHHGVGRAWLHLGEHARAAASLERAREQRAGHYPDCDVLLARLHLEREDDAAADTALAATRFERPAAERVRHDVRARLERVRGGARRALLVGIDGPGDTDGDGHARGAVADIEAMTRALITHARFAPGDIVRLTNANATREAVLDAFETLCDDARNTAATFFHFAGTGSTDADGAPTLLCADSRRRGVPDLALETLRRHARGSNLVAVLDAGWNPSLVTSTDAAAHLAPGVGESRRTVRPRPLAHPSDAVLDWSLERRAPRRFPLDVGAVTIVNALALPPVYDALDGEEIDGVAPLAGGGEPGVAGGTDLEALERPREKRDGKPVRGTLGVALVAALANTADSPSSRAADGGARATIAGWIASAEATGLASVRAFGRGGNRRLFDNFPLREDCAQRLGTIERLPLDDLVAMLERTIEERSLNGDRCAWGVLAVGVAERERGRIDAAVARLRDAISRLEKSDAGDGEHEARLADARYLLGKTLHETRRDLPDAISALEKAHRHAPDDPHVLFHLGQAMIAMVERETRAAAEGHLRHYLALGAPLGREEEISAYLRSRVDPDDLRDEPVSTRS